MADAPKSRQHQKAALTLWAYCPDRSAQTAAARANGPGSLDYWAKKVDPEGVMSDADREKAAANAKRLFYIELTEKRLAAKRARLAVQTGGE
ncbi:hypothetical protein ACQPZP_14480 [Spirillospora sp. CA-142024]|uniref:hypothetical protein n=1 Tax=Spirillospora sp. CA-142024 TaxID=3240036 RepID=UPI003D93BA9F